MNINLLIPNLAGGKHFLQPPIDVLTHSAVLKSQGHNVTFLDNRVSQFNLDELPHALPSADINVVNTAPYDFSQMYHFDYRLDYSFATIDALKDAAPTVPLVLTGIHGAVRPDLMLKHSKADAVLLGETDVSLPFLADAVSRGKSFNEAKNLVFRSSSGNSPSPVDSEMMHPSLEGLALPDYSSISLSDYYGYELVGDRFKRLKNWGVVLGSRGCAYECKFCHNFFGNNVRVRNPDSVVDELQLLEESEASHVFFLDSNITFNRAWLSQVTQGIRGRGLSVPWSAQTRFDLVDERVLEDMASANCRSICYGLESYNADVLTKMDKRIGLSQIDKAVHTTRKAGIVPQMFVMLGAPGETRQSLRDTVSFLRDNELPYIAIVYGLRFGSQFEREFYADKSLDWSDLGSLKGRVDNKVDEVLLGKTVRYLRNQNVLRSDVEVPAFL